MKHTGVLLGLFATLGLACTASGVPGLHGFEADGGGSGSSSGSSSGGSGGSGGSSSGGSSGYGSSSSGTSSGAPGDDGGVPPGDDGGVPPGDDASAPPPPVDSGNPFQFNFPDTGLGGSSSSSGGSTEGGSPCHGQNKLCIDPVFDCILQGCGLNSACVGAICQ